MCVFKEHGVQARTKVFKGLCSMIIKVFKNKCGEVLHVHFFSFWGVSLLFGKEEGIWNSCAFKKGACMYIYILNISERLLLSIVCCLDKVRERG